MSVELVVPLVGPMERHLVTEAVARVLQRWQVVGPPPEISGVEGPWPEPAPEGTIRSDTATLCVGDVWVELVGQAYGTEPLCFVFAGMRDDPHFLLMIAVAVAIALSSCGTGVILDEWNYFGLGRGEVPATEAEAQVRTATVRPQTLQQLTANLREWLAQM